MTPSVRDVFLAVLAASALSGVAAKAQRPTAFVQPRQAHQATALPHRPASGLARSRPGSAPVVMMAQKPFKWNLNSGRSPYGFADNAEVWNSRVSMMAFTWVMLEELLFGPILKAYDGTHFPGIGHILFSGVFIAGLVFVNFNFLTNQQNDEYIECDLDSLEDYMRAPPK